MFPRARAIERELRRVVRRNTHSGQGVEARPSLA
jgi:hypothetical protein